ncbi:CvpA family protein [Pistricoccus aurantiacus]|uniref:CvpA family protein n=1 Tax=Pistricoccus aurantiacus TaxID=1883414 RepID=A0A5B8T056_9GAMM|nr:CvpA family protein [Pistricoccus aurantiacus]QEA40350.1 CvpA family protein [Pistricoccus aurantiacus]
MTLTWLDIAFLGILTFTVVAGFMRGLVREGLGLAAWVLAILAARAFAMPVANALDGLIENPDVRLILAFVLVIFAVIMLCGLAIRMLHAAVEWVGMGLFNRLAGAAFGGLKGGAILVLATFLIGLTPLEQLQAWQQAQLRPQLLQLQDWALDRWQEWDKDSPGRLAPLKKLAPSEDSVQQLGF